MLHLIIFLTVQNYVNYALKQDAQIVLRLLHVQPAMQL